LEGNAIARLTIHPMLKEIAALFKAKDREVCLVGGAVRDMLRRKKAHDFDLATNALPEEVTDIFRKTQPRSSVVTAKVAATKFS
jgi:tRNA nucleotidyltransferase/poly(A) polymerase